MATEAQRKASAKYDKENTRSIILKLNKISDADVLTKLDEQPNKQGYIKQLVRADIKGTEDVLTIDDIRIMILPVAKKYKMEQVYLFGSYARGEASSDSDIDLYVQGSSIKYIREYMNIIEKLQEATGKEVDVIMSEAIDSSTRSGRRLLEHIDKEKVLLYEAIQ